jgi:beta-galactosidase
MRRVVCVAFAVVGLSLLSPYVRGAVPADSPELARVMSSFDKGWLLNKGEAAGAQAPGFADGGWVKFDAPYDWAIEGPYDQNAPSMRGGGYLPSGIAWYRKHFPGIANLQGKKVYLHFEGVMANAEVWINGKSVGKRPYGYVPQHYDITEHLVTGDNVVAVRTDTTQQPASRWYTGQGIYRHVRLIVQDAVHIENFGTQVITPQIAADSATVKVINTVVNQSAAAAEVLISTTLMGPDGKAAGAGKTTTRKIEPGKSETFEQEIKVANPKLWDIASPNMYKALSKVQNGSSTLDEESASFGIRTAEYKAESGFWLNGKNIKILGVCMHHDGGAVGSAVPLRVHERRLEILRSIGVNAIRTAHNPVNPDYLDLCDRMGFMVMEETFDTWTAAKPNATYGYNMYFNQWWQKDTTDTIMRDRNHPSLIIWSVGNEIRDNLTSADGFKRMKDQIDLVHQLDPTRPVTMGLFRPTANAPYIDLLDVIGANYNAGFLQQVRNAKPERKTTVSEDSHGAPAWAAVRDNPAIAGTFIWSGFDYLGETAEAGSWPYVVSSSASNGFGIFEHTGYFRPRSYERQSWWSTTPMVRALRNQGHAGEGPLVEDWTPADPSTFDKARVQAYTNCDEAELLLNNTSLGTKPRPRTGGAIVWDLDYQPGTLKIVGKNGGQVVATHELKTADDATKLGISADRLKIANEFDDVSHIIVQGVDDKGIVNPYFNDDITIKVEGPGKLIATSTGDRTSHQSFASPTRKAYHGEIMAIVRSTADSGTITVTATAPGVQPVTIKLEAAPAGKAK